ncbi:SWIM zinc finger family protein [Fusobacterium varium]|uniref:SWIM zinc finger family protein n=1 Tax=Fusobacterium varium ATCC 27725 TaxID=469618 RepID=A0ABN5JGX2_FUSVA|nr:SWIM zinc finger family protein [Fusobacterium varium]AVQ31245.1 SWIM zinc finger family protein [Fusobacterium varium ATCC 27725]EES62564.1 SWIM zinc finger domain protein [Fusobacterium varium ATCC 27725]VEH40048.1 SWIM zinc finger [Fusobacterium varium]
MDSKNSVINEIKPFLPFINEEFIVSISNKGIYKRSIKDLEKARENILLSVKDTGIIEVKIEDVVVELNVNIQKSRCTCPASSICKHIVMALLYLKEFYDSNQNEEEKEIEEDKEEKIDEINFYEELKKLTGDKILEIVGKKTYNSVINSIFIRNEAIFEYGDMLTVTIASQNAKVYFPKEKSIENAMCSCKEKGICSHKIYALISYLIKEGKITEEDTEYETIEIGEKEKEIIENLHIFISSIFDRGISGLTGNEISQAEKFYIQIYGIKLFASADELKNLSSELGFYFSKNISFSNKRLMHILCSIYNRTSALLIVKDNRKKIMLVGQRQEEKFNLDNIELIGLGASGGITKRNDLLITAYFYCKDINSILSMSTLRPYENSSQISTLYNMGQVWSNELSFKEVSVSKMILKDAKLSTGKISSAKSTICNIKGKTTEEDINELAVSDYSLIITELRKHKFRYFEPYSATKNIFLIKAEEIKNIEYDKIEQKLKFDVLDSNGNTIVFDIKYNSVSENAIKYFEKNKTGSYFEYILGSITEKNGIMNGKFLSGIQDGKIKNIFF